MRNLDKIKNLIGNTPMLEIIFNYKGEKKRIFAKLEYYNLTGSIKDRIAYHIIKRAYEKGEIKKGDTIVEATSGNTGIAFSAMGAYTQNPVIIYMPDWMSEERKKLISSFGAEIRLVSKEEGGFLGSIDKAEKLAKDNDNVFLPRQFENKDNMEAQCLGLGKEILEFLDCNKLVCGGFVAGVGTGGTVMGVNKAFKEAGLNAKVYPLEPLESPTLSTGYKVGTHRIAGISDEFIPDLVKLDELDEVVSVSDADAILMAQKFAKLGLGVGISSGANFIGAVKKLSDIDGEMVTVFTDDSKKYLSTDLMSDIEEKEEYVSKDIEILELIAHK